MRLASRLVLATFGVVALAVAIALGGRDRGVPAAVLVALPVALGVAWVIARVTARPLVDLAEAARNITTGTQPRFPHSAIPEIDTLAHGLRRMHGELTSRTAELNRERAGGNAIVQAMVEGVIASDGRGRIVVANPAARRLLGYGADAVMPSLPMLFRVREARGAVSQVLAGREVHDCEVELDGRVLLLNARPLPDQGAVLVLHDLTDARRLEAVRRDFVANVSHELKTPLTSIAGYADTLTDTSLDTPTQQRFLAVLINNTRRMQRLVDDLLDLSRIESGRWTPHLETSLMEAVVDDAWEPFRERAAARQVHFALEIAVDATQLWVDPVALRQVLTNLFDNALRYVPSGGHIHCRGERTDGGITVSVADDGSGIAGEHLPRIFERFYRVDPARSREEGGTGLGLAIVRHMVEAHGGLVEARSELQHGLTVRSWFPDREGEGPAMTDVPGA
jgi:two-component system phosphate regulon sensor histidine kinase PhoR